jgi:hypothetical protein
VSGEALGKARGETLAGGGAAGEEAPEGAAARVVAQFSAVVERLGGIKTSAVAEALGSLGAGPLSAAASGEAAAGRTAAAETTSVAEALPLVLGYGVLALLRGVLGPAAAGEAVLALIGHWQLDRKLRECLRVLGIQDHRSRQAVEIMKALLGRTRAPIPGRKESGRLAEPAAHLSPAAGSASAWAAAFIADNYDTEDFRRLLGINRFNDVTWFNKEAFEEALFYSSLFLYAEDQAVLGPAFAGGKDGLIAEFDRVLIRAEKASGYQLDGFIRALAEDS